jgi:hypothetical protein
MTLEGENMALIAAKKEMRKKIKSVLSGVSSDSITNQSNYF